MSDNPTLNGILEFAGEVEPESVGLTQAGVARVAALFEEQMTQGLHPAAQLVVLRHGRVVLDRAAGIAQRKRQLPVTPSTPFLTFSVTKVLTAACVHRLLEEGQVELDAPIADYWPEFGCKGKESATIRHALLHQTGIPARGLNQQTLHWPSWQRVTRNVAALPAEFPPGSQTAYHLVNNGFILGEVVRRVAGVPIALYLRQTFLNPLHLWHTWLGLPTDQLPRTAEISYGDRGQRGATLLFSLAAIRRAVVPAASLHSTARDLATFYQMLLNGGRYAGRVYLQPATIQRATALAYEGYDATIQMVMRWGHGFQLGGSDPAKGIAPDGASMGHGSSARTFGHFGNATSMTWADPDAGLVVAFLCNRLLSDTHSRARWRALSNAIWDTLEG